MRRYLKIYRTFFVSSFARELEFRVNFFAQILKNLMWIFFFVMIMLVIYSNTDSVAGWSQGDATILMGTLFLMNSVIVGFFMSVREIPEQVRLGTLDFIITKPIDTQFWISTRKFQFDEIGAFLAGAVTIIIGVVQSGANPNLEQWLAYLVLVLCSIVLFYSFLLALMTTGIWLIRVDNLWVLGDSVQAVTRYPIDIYTTGIQRIFTFFVPLAFISTIPSRQLVLRADWTMVGLGMVWAVVAFALVRWFWRFALTRYTSASS